MKITLNTEDEQIILSNEQLNNDNFIDIIIDDKDYTIDDEGHTVVIDELLIAVQAFYKLREEQQLRDAYYERYEDKKPNKSK